MNRSTHSPVSTPVLGRRAFVGSSLAVAAAAVLPAVRSRAAARPSFSSFPFSLGVASGDPAPDGFVLWTRLAPRPLEKGGGMRPEPVDVVWEVADDEAFSRVASSGTAVADPRWGHSVHVEVSGLRPDRWYWYRFTAGGAESTKGRARTLPAAESLPGRLRFAFASCQNYESGHYTAYEHMAREDLDLVVHLGDYIYEGAAHPGRTRLHNGGEIFTLDDYRLRYALYRSDPALQAAHALAPWIVTWDDHEVANNYAGDIPGKPGPRDEFLRRRAAAYQAYYEMMPLRRAQLPAGPDMALHRSLEFGRLARFHVLDTRQFRTDQPLGDGRRAPSPVLLDPRGTLLGDRQRAWLESGLETSPAAWNILAQQVMMARVDHARGPEELYSMDQWPGYEFERRRVLRHLRERRVRNPVVLTGDIHSNWANELPADPERPDAPPVAVEFVGTSISSGGDGSLEPAHTAELMAENPFVKYRNNERGYVRCEVSPGEWRSDYRTVPYVERRGAPVNTRATFVVESGRPALRRA